MPAKRIAGLVLRAAILFCACAVTLRAATGAPLPVSVAAPSVQRAIVAAIEKGRRVYGGRTPIPGVLLGVWDGAGGSFVRTFGYADLAKRRPLRADDHFYIGSNTKTFVVAVLLQLVDEKKLSLDDPLSRFSFGVKIPNGQNVTVRELCEMRSGLFEAYNTPQVEKLMTSGNGNANFDARTMVGWAMQQKPYFAPDKRYRYTNTNYLILGLIVESLTHDTIADQIRKRLLVPYDLTQTSYPNTEAMPDPWARGYAFDKNRNWEDVSGTIPVSLMGATGAMISDMADMRRWIPAYVNGKPFSAAMHRALMQCKSVGAPGQGFGLALGCSSGWYGYTGGLPGYNTANYLFPATGAFVVVWVDAQIGKPDPGVANAMFRDVARTLTPRNVPYPPGANGL
ncbi:MAG: beta-lactamase family protein [Candidatus Eremiobacteraeota bacterium]|nr:beta-lactamase family protein [Candidatus Eremiobacteraeota bacterium]